jgi:hypothetical protein
LVNEECKESEDEQMKPYPIKETISFKDFEKLDIRVGTVTSVSELVMLTTLRLALQCLKYECLMVQEPDDLAHSDVWVSKRAIL